MNPKKYWLTEALLCLQDSDEEKHRDAWNYVSKITGKNASSFHSVPEAIATAYSGMNEDEQKEFLRELGLLIQFSKTHKLSLWSMDAIIFLIAILGLMDMFAEKLARNFVFHWRNAAEREFLARVFLSSCSGVGPSEGVSKAVSYLREHKWTPRRYAIDTCMVLLEAKPDRWFNTLARMLPVMSRYKNKLIREQGKSGRETWRLAEECLRDKMKELELM